MCYRYTNEVGAERTGLEPATSNVTGWRSNQLSYRSLKMVEVTGFEPMTFCLQSRRSTN